MVRKTKIMENEKHTVQYIEIWQETLKNEKNEESTLQYLEYGQKHFNLGK